MKDMINQQLNVGDYIIYSPKRKMAFYFGKIVEVENARIKVKSVYWNAEYCMFVDTRKRYKANQGTPTILDIHDLVLLASIPEGAKKRLDS